HQRDVVALANGDRLAGLEGVVVGVDLRNAHPADPDEHGTLGCRGPSHGGSGLDRVGWHDNDDVVDGAEPGDVLDRVVGGAELPVGDTGTHAAEFHVAVRVGDVCLDLLQGSR